MIDSRDPEARTYLFLHGVFGRQSDFAAVASALMGRGRTLAPTLPIAASGGAVENAAGLCRLVEKKLDEGNVTRALLVGNALGGHVAIAFALKHPERTAGLVLSGSSLPNGGKPRLEGRGFQLGELDVPTLLLWGSNDRVTPPDVARELHDRIRRSRLLFLPDCGHAPMTERAGLFAFHLAAFANDVFPRPKDEAAA
jgi:2-hydroxy-6-oxonona-2,4-dienedioate hydrolase